MVNLLKFVASVLGFPDSMGYKVSTIVAQQ